MGSVGLLYVGAVLFLNGMMLLGRVDARSAAPLNIFVGGLQVITPTYLIFTANGDPDVILAASGLYLFGFTYLYVAFNLLAGTDGTGLGYFSLFVAVCARGVLLPELHPVRRQRLRRDLALLGVPVDAVLRRARARRRVAERYTGAVAAVQGWVTGVIPAFLLLTGNWAAHVNTAAIVLAVAAVVLFGLGYPLFRGSAPTPTPAQSPHRLHGRLTPGPASKSIELRGRGSHARGRIPARLHQEVHRPAARRAQPLAPGHPGGRDGQAGRHVPRPLPGVVRRRDPQRRLGRRRPATRRCRRCTCSAGRSRSRAPSPATC